MLPVNLFLRFESGCGQFLATEYKNVLIKDNKQKCSFFTGKLEKSLGMMSKSFKAFHHLSFRKKCNTFK